MEVFCERIKTLMEQREITQMQLAENLGILTSRLNHYINGRHRADLELTARIAKSLGTTTDYLLGRVDYPAPIEGRRKLHSFKEGAVFDISGSEGRAVQRAIYRSSDPQNSPPAAFYNVINYEYAIYNNSYALIMGDDSMEPFFKKGDLVNISELKIDPLILQGSKQVYAIREKGDNIGRLIRFCEVHKDMLVLTAANPAYPAKLINLKKRRYDIIAGYVIVTLRRFR